ncbi:endo alpha-1,4 polygalactosaminidase [Haliovirga abyssi]|uniref:Glycoside-hydrolase family GH114 TIM-barrel domain-containing protein n=1 Tax=Haliovirga abyssi TaxID=2996794 RepID=A0AAU9D380_9FUSO|nr:endo alpha-1,4 polygalactosaminidase [Haliovirga abyssi]BDU50426.1 hypothetical protein HLVA_09950 [Haliovirga abyssi]
MKKPFMKLIIISMFMLSGCFNNNIINANISRDYRQDMRDFIKSISAYSKNINHNFIIIPQNGQELITDNGESNGILKLDYINSIDATGREELFYGYNNIDEKTAEEDKQHLLDLCHVYEKHNIKVLVTDYSYTHSKMDDSYKINEKNGFISFAANTRELNKIPDYPKHPFNENSNNINNISQAKNFLYLINSENFITKGDFITAVSATNYDVVIMDLFHNEKAYNSTEIKQLKIKKNGNKRLVVCYMSIGEAENYRYYWDKEWDKSHPLWLDNENPSWKGNFKVKYWNKNWHDIIFGNDNSYLKKIIDAGFDGVYLDIIDAYEYFEEK